MTMKESLHTPEIPVDHDQRRRAVQCLDLCLCVEAGAGTGKTTLLVDRVISILRSDPRLEMENLVAITFTEKAAEELKLKVREKLQQESNEDIKLQKALWNLDQACISTIHSFAAAMLRERPVEACIDPDFSVLDEIGNQLLLDELWVQWLTLRMEDGSEGVRNALRLGIKPEQMQKIAVHIYNHRELLPLSLEDIPELPDIKDIVDFFNKSVYRLSHLGQKHCLDKSDKGFKNIEDIERHQAKIQSMGNEGSLKLIMDDVNLQTNKGKKKNWNPEETCSEQKEICRDMKARLERFREDAHCRVAVDLFQELAGFVDHVQQEKRRRGQMDFHDLLIHVRDLLKGHLDVRRYFQERFRHILVDEFQDTDPLQVEIVFFLAEEGPQATRWEDVRLYAGKLFLVGDPKQSIYRFRRADLELYARAREIIDQQGEIITISQNFRSVPGVINWVNTAFRPLIQPPDEGNYQPHYEDLLPYRKDDCPGPAVQRLAVGLDPEDSGKSSIKEVRRQEAQQIAEAVAAREWKIQVAYTGQWRPSQFRDVAILFPLSSDIELYEDALQTRGIPYHLEAGQRFYRREETVDLAAVLASVDNPRDELALVAAMRSSFFGVSDEEIFVYKSGGGILDYQKGRPEEDSTMGQACIILRELHGIRNARPIAQVVGLLLEKTRALERLSLQPGGQQAVSNLYKLAEQARAFGAPGGVSFRRFVRWLDQMRREERQEEDFPTAGGEDDAVSLLTIHKAKGLEFPVVIIANLMSVPRHGGACVANWAEGRLDLALGDKASGFCTPGYREALRWNEVREEAEDSRLLYVAATRAQDWLVIPDSPAKGKSFGIRLTEALASLPPLIVHKETPAGVQTPRKGDTACEGRRCEALARYHRWKENRERLLLETLRSIPLVTPSGTEELAVNNHTPTDSDGPDALGLGKAFHAVMAAVDLPKGKDLERRVRNAAAFYGMKGEEGLLLRMARDCLASRVMTRAREGLRLFREAPLSVIIEGRIIEGSVDLIIEEQDGLVVVDYKTDDVEKGSLENRAAAYWPQLRLYARSLAETGGKPVKEAIILFARTGEEWTWPIPPPETAL